MKIVMQHGHYPDDGSRDEWEIMEYYEKFFSQTGAEVVTYGQEPPDLAGCDIVHLFGMSAAAYNTCKEAVKAGIPVVATPLYWNDDYPIHYDLRHLPAAGEDPAIRERKLSMSYFRKMMLLTKVRQQKFVLDNAKFVFATGRCEKMLLARDFTLPDAKIVIMPVGVDLAMGMGKPELFLEKYGVEDFVLCVGQLMKRKNQHLLIDITREIDVPVVFSGPMDENDEYMEYCRAIAHGQTHFLGELHPMMLKSAFHAARAFVLPGLSELPGVGCLGAALAGCPIAVTERGSAWDYLGPGVQYCDPEELDSVTYALDRALTADPNPDLKKQLLTKFSWGKVMVFMSKLYRKIVDAQKT